MKSCKNCAHAKFDEHWGDYKCLLHKRRCGPRELVAGCGKYARRNNPKQR
jgi:hypothetical protein